MSVFGRLLSDTKDSHRPIVDVQQLQNSAKRCLGRKKSGLAVPDLAASSGLSVLDSLPQGMPGFTIPWITNANIVPMLIVGCAVALVSFADTDLLSRVYAARTRTYVDVSLADILAEVDETQRAAGITLCVTEMKDPSQGEFKRFGVYTLLGEARIFPC